MRFVWFAFLVSQVVVVADMLVRHSGKFLQPLAELVSPGPDVPSMEHYSEVGVLATAPVHQTGHFSQASADPVSPGPNVLWVEQSLVLGSAAAKHCCGCHCLMLSSRTMVGGDTVSQEYTCGGPGKVPDISWWTTLATPTQSCDAPTSFAVTVADLDYPNGMGQMENRVEDIFWAVDIPATWNWLNSSNVYEGPSSGSVRPLCPSRGTHRFKVTVWALDSFLGSEELPVSSTTTPTTVLSMIRDHEIIRTSAIGRVRSTVQSEGMQYVPMIGPVSSSNKIVPDRTLAHFGP